MNRDALPLELPEFDLSQLARFNRRNKLSMRLARLGQHEAPNGRLVLFGRLGALRLMIVQGETDAAGATAWDLELVEP